MFEVLSSLSSNAQQNVDAHARNSTQFIHQAMANSHYLMAEALGQPPDDRHGLSEFSRHCGDGRPPHDSTSAVFTDRLQRISIPANTSSDVPSITDRGLGCPQCLAHARSHSRTQKQHDISGIHREEFLFPSTASDCAKFPTHRHSCRPQFLYVSLRVAC